MLTIDLSSLSPPELKRLIEAARARGQDALVAQLSAQLKTAGARQLARGPATAFVLPRDRVWIDEEDEPEHGRGAPWGRAALFAAALGAATVALALDLRPADPPPVREAAPQRLQMAVVVPAPAPAAAPVTDTQPEPEAAPPVIRASIPRAGAPARRNPCYDEPTPAERLVCGYPVLAQQDRALKSAVQRAVAAGADPEAIQRDQAAWKAASTGVSDRFELAQRYQARIRELEAAAAETLSTP